MAPHLASLDDSFELHRSAGAKVLAACGGEIFPCDALALAVLDRSLGLIRGFTVLSENGGYASAMALLRMQLDNVLRLRGVIASGRTHEIAERMFRGEQLRDLNDKTGKKMTDRHLLSGLSASAPWAHEVYELSSGYVHLSSNHISYFLARCGINADGQREFAIGDEDEHVPEEGKRRLAKAFTSTTNGVLSLVAVWHEVRDTHGTNAQLKRVYKPDV